MFNGRFISDREEMMPFGPQSLWSLVIYLYYARSFDCVLQLLRGVNELRTFKRNAPVDNYSAREREIVKG